jgi:hypothetical protein
MTLQEALRVLCNTSSFPENDVLSACHLILSAPGIKAEDRYNAATVMRRLRRKSGNVENAWLMRAARHS